MELRVLRYFLAVARVGTITGAAEALHVTQPTLSKQLADLERELGCSLFRRGKRAIALTNDGRLLLERAQDIVDLADKTEAEFAASAHREVWGEVYLGCGETQAMDIIGTAARRLHADHPHIRLNIVSGDADDLTERLDQGQFDFVLFCGAINLEKYDYLRLPWTDTWGVIMPEDHPLAAKERVTASDLMGEPLIFPRQAHNHNELAGWFGPDMSRYDVAMTHTLIWNGTRMVKQGIGLALSLGGLAAVGTGTGLAFRPIHPGIENPVYLGWRKRRTFSRASETFLIYLRGELERGLSAS